MDEVWGAWPGICWLANTLPLSAAVEERGGGATEEEREDVPDDPLGDWWPIPIPWFQFCCTPRVPVWFQF